MSLLGKLVDRLLPTARLVIVHPDGTREEAGGGDGKRLTIKLHDKKVVADLIRSPRLAIGETYMDGRLTIEDGTILDFLRLVLGANSWEEGGRSRRVLQSGKGNNLLARLRRNAPTKSRQNVAHHYDLGDDLYEAFLDADRQYSCAYFRDGVADLEQAQLDKKAHIAAKLHLKPGQRVLDIGCGWGGMALYLNKVADVDVLGVTLSDNQLATARRRAEEAGVSDRVKFELIDYRSLQGQFDRIVSVGMFEHVGKAHFTEYFAKCRDLLAPDGVMLLHTIGKYGHATAAPDPFVNKYIFPGSYLPSLIDIIDASADVRLIASDIETLRLHYGITIEHWLERFEQAREQMAELYDERFCRMWEFYLAGAIAFFEHGAGCNYQVQYVRDRHALPLTRDYMAEAEARYRAAVTLD